MSNGEARPPGHPLAPALLIGFPFFGNYCIFTHLFDCVCHFDLHEPLKAQQATTIMMPF